MDARQPYDRSLLVRGTPGVAVLPRVRPEKRQGMIMGSLESELAHRASMGQQPVNLAEIEALLAPLGYRLDRTMDCRSQSRYMTGPREGESYPCITTGIRERDSGLTAWNFQARRDDNFYKLQALRLTGEVFAVISGAILEI
jgi:hypothetical protein